MNSIEKTTREIDAFDLPSLPLQELVAGNEPVILKGFAQSWPLVQAGNGGPVAAMDYLRKFYNQSPLVAYIGAPEIEGRFGYNAEVTGLNFFSERLLLEDFFQRIEENLNQGEPPAFYIGSTSVDACLPGLRTDNDLISRCAELQVFNPLMSIWMGNRTVARAHFDTSNNIACSLVGKRRFILFPPDQVENLYPGPLEPTPGGQVVTMVDLHQPDFERYPKAREALAAGQVADLDPGDVLFYPALWWHQVEAQASFNVMVNYWWNPSPAFMDTPMNTLLHGMLSLRDRPDSEKRAWRALFDYYLFGPAERPAEHLPEQARGPLAELDPMTARRLRAMLRHKLNR